MGERLDAFLARVRPELSRSRIKALIEQGQVTLNGRPAKASQRPRPGDQIRLIVPAPEEARAEAEEIPLAILYEDEHLIGIDKPPGLVVHPAAGARRGTLVNALLFHCKELPGIGGERRPGIVHRLDRFTSGCLVVAKTEPAMVELQRQFKSRGVKKTYLAIVVGRPPDAGAFDTLYGRHPKDRKRFTTRVREGRRAQLRFRTVERFPGAGLVEVELLTGRTHQIRVQFGEAGFPVLGDEVYAPRKWAKGPHAERLERARAAIGRQALHARDLELVHPHAKVPLALHAPLPEDFERALAVLRER